MSTYITFKWTTSNRMFSMTTCGWSGLNHLGIKLLKYLYNNQFMERWHQHSYHTWFKSCFSQWTMPAIFTTFTTERNRYHKTFQYATKGSTILNEFSSSGRLKPITRKICLRLNHWMRLKRELCKQHVERTRLFNTIMERSQRDLFWRDSGFFY